MSEYDELIANLRNCANVNSLSHYKRNLMKQAADAIKKLSRELEYANEWNRAMYDASPKWIPVTERLPEDGKFVLVCNDDGHMMIAKHESEVYEWYYKYTNYDFDLWDNEEQGPVRYWTPLPKLPVEE